MKSWKSGSFLRGKADEGNILALVLIMVIFLSLWLSSVFLFTASAKKATTTNITQTQAKEAAINSAIEQTLAIINNTSAQGIGKLLGDVTSAGGDCSKAVFPDYVAPDGTTISVSCSQSANSGNSGPLASWVVTGSCTSGPGCVTGTDAGISIVNDGTGCPSTKLTVSGGTMNVNGASVGQTSCVFGLDTVPGQPVPINQAAVTPPNEISGTNNSGNTVNKVTVDPSVKTKTEEEIANQTNYGHDGSAKDSKTTDPTKNLALFGDGLSELSCPGSTVTVSIPTANDPKGFANLNSAMIAHLSWLSSCPNPKPIVFNTGTYRFNDTAGTGSEWWIKKGTVIGGTSKSGNTDCDSSASGVQFQFNKGTFVRQTKAKVYLCSLTAVASGSYDSDKNRIKPVIYAPRQTESDHGLNKFYWSANGKTNSLGKTDLWTMDSKITTSDGKDAEHDSSAVEYAFYHQGDNHDGSESFDTWSSSEQNTYAARIHTTLAKMSSDDKAKAIRAVNVKKIDDKSDVHFTNSYCLDCLTVHGSWFSPAASVNFSSSKWSKWVIEQGILSLAMTIHVDGQGGKVTPAVAGNYRDGRFVELYLKNAATRRMTIATVYVNDDSGRHPANHEAVTSLTTNIKY